MKKFIFVQRAIVCFLFLFCMVNASVAATVVAPVKHAPAALVAKTTATALHAQLNINTASVKELAVLSGMNTSKARAIVAWRKKNGAFTSLDALHKVSGFKRITEEKWQALTAQLTINKS